MRGAGHAFQRPARRVVGDEVKLRALWWDGELPEPGDMLQTSTGRRYLIRTVGARSPAGAFTLRCVIAPGDCALPPGRSLFLWTWTRRSTRRPKAFR